MRRRPIWKPPVVAFILSAVLWAACATVAFAQESYPEPVVRHYMTAVESVVETGDSLRVEFHLLIGYDRTTSLVLGGDPSAPVPSYRAGIAGNSEYEEDRLCFEIDSVWGPGMPKDLVGQRACYVYNPEADTMAPINDLDGTVMERATLPRPPAPTPEGT